MQSNHFSRHFPRMRSIASMESEFSGGNSDRHRGPDDSGSFLTAPTGALQGLAGHRLLTRFGAYEVIISEVIISGK